MSIKNNIRKVIKKLISKKTRTSEDIREINYTTLEEMLKKDKNAVLVDVRSFQEHEENRISPSINIPLYELEARAKDLLKNKNQTIILYCQSGKRSIKAYKILQEKGYTDLYTLRGGIDDI